MGALDPRPEKLYGALNMDWIPMSKPVKLKHRVWETIYEQIRRDYPPSVALIRARMKSVLGFTVREHVNYRLNFDDITADWRDHHSQIHLDFYDEPKRTMFLLKYSDVINE
jgi:hypothetical protein